MEGQRPFYTRVESLRGIGALTVAGYHFSGMAINRVQLFPHEPSAAAGPGQNALAWLGMALTPGHGALMVFFVISGFVLSLSLRHGPQQTGRLVLAFHVGRMTRIYPIIFFATAISLLISGWTAPGPPRTAVDLGLLVANLLLIDVSMNTALWAIQLEVLMAPLIVLLFILERRWGPAILVAVAVVATPLSFSPHWAIWPPLSRNLFAFALGMLVPTLGRAFAAALSRAAAARSAVAAILAVILPKTLFGMYSPWSGVVEGYGAFVLVSLVAYRADLGFFRFLDRWLWRRLGLSSGSYYVLHVPVAIWLIGLTAWLVPLSWSINAPAMVGWLMVALWLAAMMPIALASFYLVEAPGIALGRWLRQPTAGTA